MKQVSMPDEFRNCPHCEEEDKLRYYHEANLNDLYYCKDCFGIVLWDGKTVEKMEGEAYPHRKRDSKSTGNLKN